MRISLHFYKHKTQVAGRQQVYLERCGAMANKNG